MSNGVPVWLDYINNTARQWYLDIRGPAIQPVPGGGATVGGSYLSPMVADSRNNTVLLIGGLLILGLFVATRKP